MDEHRKKDYIIIADDDSDDQLFIKDALQRKSFAGSFECVENGIMLLDYLRIPPVKLPRLILLDLNMPFKNGYQTLEELKSDGQLRNIPVFVLTSSLSESDEQKCYKLGCNNFYRKPNSVPEYDALADELVRYLKAS